MQDEIMNLARPKYRHLVRIGYLAAAPLPSTELQASVQRDATSIDPRVVDSIVELTMRQRRIAGASVALVRGGHVALVKAYGFASLESRGLVDTLTRFAAGSVTKQFVAALALLLHEQGRLSVYDTLAKWYPSLTRSHDITLLDLINHVSGYRDYYPLDFVDRVLAKPTTAEHIVQTFGTAPLDFDPGTRWSYSNTGYAILGRVLERVANRPLGTLLKQRIFQPLGMRHTVYEPLSADRLAIGYTSWALGDLEPALPEGAGWLGAAGGIWSTAGDLARWSLALMRRGFLSPSSREVLFRERVLRDGTLTGYAGGLQVAKAGGRTIYSHGGAAAGFRTMIAFTPADTSVVVALANGDQYVPTNGFVALVSPPRPTAVTAPPAVVVPQVKPSRTPVSPPALETAVDFFGQLQRGQVDRSKLATEYAAFLTPARIASAARSLAPLGEVSRANVLALTERGGMQVATVRLRFASRTVTVLMYRSSKGTIEEYLFL